MPADSGMIHVANTRRWTTKTQPLIVEILELSSVLRDRVPEVYVSFTLWGVLRAILTSLHTALPALVHPVER